MRLHRVGGVMGRGLRSWRAAPLAALTLLVGLQAAQAQENRVFRDGSLGLPCPPAPSDCEVRRDDVQSIWNIDAEFGQASASGRNLFHSFSFFDVDAGWQAVFLRATDPGAPIPGNVIARVTGGDDSDIAGVIDTTDLPGANLFLLNPAGIVFTESSSLSLDGSLYASTAGALRFGAGEPVFFTGDDQTPVALADVDPTDFGFLDASPASISVARDNVLTDDAFRVPGGQTLALVGGDIDVDGNGRDMVVDIEASGGTLALASVASAVDVPVDVASFDAAGLPVDSLGSILITDEAILDAGSTLGVTNGSIVIRGGRFEMQGGELRSWNRGAVTGAERAIDIELAGRTGVTAVEGLVLDDGAAISSLAWGSVEGGDVRVVAPAVDMAGASSISSVALTAPGGRIDVDAARIRVSEGALINSENFGGSAGGDLAITASSELEVTDSGEIFVRIGNPVFPSPIPIDATAGSLTIQAGRVTVSGGGLVSSQLLAGGAGGDVSVTADTDVVVSDLGQIFSRVDANAPSGATAGNVTVSANRVFLTSVPMGADANSQISAITEGAADGGTLTIRTTELDVRDGGQLRTTTSGAGNAGAIDITGLDAANPLRSVVVSGIATVAGSTAPSGIFARSDALVAGNAGAITIAAQRLEVENGGEISARSIGAGRAGDIVIQDADFVAIRGGTDGLGLVESESAAGGAGTLTITTDQLELSGGGQASVSTLGEVDAGGIVVNAREVTLTGRDGAAQSGLFAQTTFGTSSSGDAGSISMNVSERLTVSDGARISVESRGGGVAGQIAIRDAGAVVVTDGGEISAQARNTSAPVGGPGSTGGVLIDGVGRLEVSDGGFITAQTLGTSPGGQITIRNVDSVIVSEGSITALSDGVGPGVGDAGSVVIGEPGAPVGSLLVSGGIISTQTAADGAGGDISVVATRRVQLQDGARVTAESTGSADAGSIDIDAGRQFLAVRNSPLPGEGVVSTRADNASGGTIQIRASKLVYLSDSRIETQVDEGGDEGDGGDFGTPRLLGADENTKPAELVVLNRSRIVASAVDGNGGNILIDGTFLPSEALLEDEDLAGLRDSVLDATSETGIPGAIVVTSPGSELAGQLVPLPSNYLDASKLLLTPCAARRSRAGSFTVELQATEPLPDAPFTSEATAAGALREGTEGCEIEEANR